MRHPPMARGVSNLMYVGDDVAPVASGKPSGKEIAVGLGAAAVALSSSGLVRLVSAGIATWIGYRAYKSR